MVHQNNASIETKLKKTLFIKKEKDLKIQKQKLMLLLEYISYRPEKTAEILDLLNINDDLASLILFKKYAQKVRLISEIKEIYGDKNIDDDMYSAIDSLDIPKIVKIIQKSRLAISQVELIEIINLSRKKLFKFVEEEKTLTTEIKEKFKRLIYMLTYDETVELSAKIELATNITNKIKLFNSYLEKYKNRLKNNETKSVSKINNVQHFSEEYIKEQQLLKEVSNQQEMSRKLLLQSNIIKLLTSKGQNIPHNLKSMEIDKLKELYIKIQGVPSNQNISKIFKKIFETKNQITELCEYLQINIPNGTESTNQKQLDEICKKLKQKYEQQQKLKKNIKEILIKEKLDQPNRFYNLSIDQLIELRTILLMSPVNLFKYATGLSPSNELSTNSLLESRHTYLKEYLKNFNNTRSGTYKKESLQNFDGWNTDNNFHINRSLENFGLNKIDPNKLNHLKKIIKEDKSIVKILEYIALDSISLQLLINIIKEDDQSTVNALLEYIARHKDQAKNIIEMHHQSNKIIRLLLAEEYKKTNSVLTSLDSISLQLLINIIKEDDQSTVNALIEYIAHHKDQAKNIIEMHHQSNKKKREELYEEYQQKLYIDDIKKQLSNKPNNKPNNINSLLTGLDSISLSYLLNIIKEDTSIAKVLLKYIAQYKNKAREILSTLDQANKNNRIKLYEKYKSKLVNDIMKLMSTNKTNKLGMGEYSPQNIKKKLLSLPYNNLKKKQSQLQQKKNSIFSKYYNKLFGDKTKSSYQQSIISQTNKF